MNLRQAAEMALKRLDMYFVEHGNDDDFAALQALRQALAQPEREPMLDGKWVLREVFIGDEGEPLAHREPPKREWVGLTDDEFTAIARKYSLPTRVGLEYFKDELEAKLKEKNT